MSSCEEMSDSSNIKSPQYSPQYSPLQQVPQLANLVGVMTCTDNASLHRGVNGPQLKIIEQPQDHFRFRYRSEMVGTHGCLLGKSENSNRGKTHPTVELLNFDGRARIRCRLAQIDNDDDHPHQLLEDDEDHDVTVEVPNGNSYIVKFSGLGIIHTAKKDVPQMLFKKYAHALEVVDVKTLRTNCENIAKNINLNIVRLKFSAHDLRTGKEICPPVFSEPIHNMKSALTNDLRICRISRSCGKVRGGDNLFLLVEKVNKKNIEVHFFQNCPKTGDTLWRRKGRFSHIDVHHQYAIVCKTPAYINLEIESDVDVHIELVRPSDGRSSEPVSFTYKADPVLKNNKKRKAESFSSYGSSSGSFKSTDLPATVRKTKQPNVPIPSEPMDATIYNEKSYVLPINNSAPPPCDNFLANALFDEVMPPGPQPAIVSPVLSQVNVPIINHDLAVLHSEDLGSLTKNQDFTGPILSDDFNTFLSSDTFMQYLVGYNMEDDYPNFKSMRQLQPDGVKKKAAETKMEIEAKEEVNEKINRYAALYSETDGPKVKKLVRELCEAMVNKKDSKKEDVRMKLRQLMDTRLNNGDTFLHMTLCVNMLPSMEFIVKLIHSLKLTHLLNLVNHESKSILHLAIKKDMTEYIPFLIANGCDPMVEDKDGNNAVHYAVMYENCLLPLLNAIKSYGVNCDLNAPNNEKESALHLAAQHGSAESVSLLLAHGASHNARDIDSRTPLHLAIYNESVDVTKALLAYIPNNEIDEVDGSGSTPLQIACGLQQQNKHLIEVARLLLSKGAHPLKTEHSNDSAWSLSIDQPELRALLREYLPADYVIDEDIKSEPEDDYETTEEEFTENYNMAELHKYVNDVSAILDQSGRWRELAARLHQDTLINYYNNLPNPTAMLLAHVKENNNFSSRSLAMILNEMGEKEAANLIYKYLD